MSLAVAGAAFLLAIERTKGVVMMNAEDMSMPVTRSELREELQQLGQRTEMRFGQVDQRVEQVDQRLEQIDRRFEQIDQRFEQIDRRLAQAATKVDLEVWGGAVAARFMELDARLDAQFARIANEFRELREVDLPRQDEKWRIELTRHSFASYEAMLSTMKAGDEKYADLPGR
jgi:predicted RNase H-like nuclease (RuvC/YqgF family)